MTENVLLIGGGGREHAMAWKLAQSPKVRHVFVAPGNGGTASGNAKISNVELSLAPVVNAETKNSEFPAVVDFCRAHKVSLVAVGPEDPLALGLADALQRAGLPCFGPSAAAAAIEASKAFAKAFMVRWDIPTAKHHTFTDFQSALSHIKSVDYPIVIKASGLSAGKGVILPESMQESEATLRQIMVDHVFGEAGNEVVIEERMSGDEASILAFTDGFTVFLMPPAQDHKRVFDGDQGPNTGGMGAYAPSPAVSAQTLNFVKEKVLQAAVDGLRKEGKPFVGVLYAGIMLTPNGPRTLEFNCRFGDPETQVLLPLLETDLFDIMQACVNRCLDSLSIKFSQQTAATVVAASGGYPGSYPKGKVISLPSSIPAEPNTIIFHAGTKLDAASKTLATSGGRVLTVTGVAPTLKEALQRSYSVMSSISFDGMQYRKDIGHRALKWFADHSESKSAGAKPVRLGVLGSTRGSSLQPVIDAIQSGRLNAIVSLVVANKSDAFILERAKQHGIPSKLVEVKGRKREEYDLEVSQLFSDAQVDLILLIGYMRIVSPPFVQRWRNRIMNVHPSLLPAFAGGMDLQVHQAVIAAGVPETGCTIHWVDEGVDTGPVVVQKKCPVLKDDTPETLKARVQALEGEAFIEAIESWAAGQRVSAL